MKFSPIHKQEGYLLFLYVCQETLAGYCCGHINFILFALVCFLFQHFPNTFIGLAFFCYVTLFP